MRTWTGCSWAAPGALPARGPAPSELGALTGMVAGDGRSRAARLARRRGAVQLSHDKCSCTPCHCGQGEAPGGGPRAPQGCGAVAERRVRGVSSDSGCCLLGWQGNEQPSLLDGQEQRAPRQHPRYSLGTKPVLAAGLRSPCTLSHFFLFLIPVEANRVSVSLKSKRNLMKKLNSIPFP